MWLFRNEVKTSEAELKRRMEDILRESFPGYYFCDHDRQGLCKITKSEERERKMQINATDALGEGKISRLFWKLALPAIAAQVINLLYNLVDRMYIGHIPTEGQAGAHGCRRVPAADYDYISLCLPGQYGRCAACVDLSGQGRP